MRLEPNKPQQLFIGSELKFGASTRQYVIRERPNNQQQQIQQLNTKSSLKENEKIPVGEGKNNKSLPETEDDLNSLTEFNTALNKRIAQMVDLTDTNIGNLLPTVKQKRKTVFINEEEQVINPG